MIKSNFIKTDLFRILSEFEPAYSSIDIENKIMKTKKTKTVEWKENAKLHWLLAI